MILMCMLYKAMRSGKKMLLFLNMVFVSDLGRAINSVSDSHVGKENNNPFFRGVINIL